MHIVCGSDIVKNRVRRQKERRTEKERNLGVERQLVLAEPRAPALGNPRSLTGPLPEIASEKQPASKVGAETDFLLRVPTVAGANSQNAQHFPSATSFNLGAQSFRKLGAQINKRGYQSYRLL